MTQVDLLIIEGWKAEGHEKIEIHRPAHGKPLIQPDDPKVVAVASDEDLPGLPVPHLDLNEVEAIADFIVRHCGLTERVHKGAAE
jgi:molybdopterin-guanine dinucleotide biosynthesis protein B